MHVHPFCKEATWGDVEKIADVMWGAGTLKRKRMRRLLDQLVYKTSMMISPILLLGILEG